MQYQDKIKELVNQDDRFLVMTAENRATIRNLPEPLGEKFIDTGITEQTMIGAAAGLALRGRIPIVHALACFLTMRAYEFIRTDVGIPNLPVKLVGFIPGVLSDGNGPTHQAVEDISIMRGIPGMRVWAPGSFEDLMVGLETVLKDPHPTYIRYNQRSIDPSVYKPKASFEIGKAERVSEGRDVAILTYGALMSEALETKTRLEEQGLSVEFLNLRSLKPLDEEAVLAALDKTKLTVLIEDHFEIGGLFSILSELMVKNKKIANLLPINLKENWFHPATLPRVLKHEQLDAEGLTARIRARVDELIQ